MAASDWEPVDSPAQRPVGAWVLGALAVVAMVVLGSGVLDADVGPDGQLRIDPGAAADQTTPQATSRPRSEQPQDRASPVPTTAVEAARRQLETVTYLDIPYRGDHHLDVWSSENARGWPTIVLLHGISKDKAAYAPLARRIAAGGAVVYNVNWHAVAPEDRADHIDALKAIACAVRFARATAVDYGGDPDRITLVGHDIGATSGATVALAGEAFTDGCPVRRGSAMPEGFVGVAGTYSYDDPRLDGILAPVEYLGGNRPLQVRLIHGEDDIVSPLSTPVMFARRLAAWEYDSRLTVLDGVGHENLLLRPSSRAVVVETIFAVSDPDGDATS